MHLLILLLHAACCCILLLTESVIIRASPCDLHTRRQWQCHVSCRIGRYSVPSLQRVVLVDVRAWCAVQIYVPKMYGEYTTERVLTMEWIDGTKPRRGSANNPSTPAQPSQPGPAADSTSQQKRLPPVRAGSASTSSWPHVSSGANAAAAASAKAHRAGAKAKARVASVDAVATGAGTSASAKSDAASARDIALVEVGVRCSLEQVRWFCCCHDSCDCTFCRLGHVTESWSGSMCPNTGSFIMHTRMPATCRTLSFVFTSFPGRFQADRLHANGSACRCSAKASIMRTRTQATSCACRTAASRTSTLA